MTSTILATTFTALLASVGFTPTASAVVVAPKAADRIFRDTGGRPITADSVTSDHYDSVQYKKGSNSLSVAGNKVRSVDYGDTPEAFELAIDRRDAGEFENAISLFKAALNEDGVRPWIKVHVPYEMAITYNRWGKYDQAVAQFNAALAADERTRLRPDILFGQAQAHVGAGDIDTALAELDQLAKEAYENKYGVRWELTASLEKARTLDDAGRAADAKREYSRLQTNASSYVGMADIDEAAKAMAQEMVGLARLAQGRVLIRDGKAAEADRFFTAIVDDEGEAAPVRAAALVGKGEAQQAQGDLKEAQVTYATVRIRFGDGSCRDAVAEATYRLADVAEQLGDQEPRGSQLVQAYLLETAQRYSDTKWGREAQKKLR